jgi:hypothetical protein
MANVAHQQQGAPMQGHRGAIPADIGAILGKPPLDEQPVLLENCRQASLYQAKPVAVKRDLVLRIDRRDTVFEIDDGAESGFKNDIRHAGFAFRPDQAILIDLEFDVQAMVAKQHDKRVERLLFISGEPARMPQPRVQAVFKRRNELAACDLVSGDRFVAAPREGNHIVEKYADPVDDLGATDFIVALPAFRAVGLGNRVRAIERIVKTAPARICRIEGVARVRRRNNELRSGDPRDLQDIFGANGKTGRLRDKVADLAKKVPIGRRVERPGRGEAMIFVDLFLQLVAKPQLVANTRCELADKPREPAPKLAGADIRSRQDLIADKVVQDFRNADSADFLVIHHVPAIKFSLVGTAYSPRKRCRSIVPAAHNSGTFNIRWRHGPNFPLAPLASAPLPFQKGHRGATSDRRRIARLAQRFFCARTLT